MIVLFLSSNSRIQLVFVVFRIWNFHHKLHAFSKSVTRTAMETESHGEKSLRLLLILLFYVGQNSFCWFHRLSIVFFVFFVCLFIYSFICSMSILTPRSTHTAWLSIGKRIETICVYWDVFNFMFILFFCVLYWFGSMCKKVWVNKCIKQNEVTSCLKNSNSFPNLKTIW